MKNSQSLNQKVVSSDELTPSTELAISNLDIPKKRFEVDKRGLLFLFSAFWVLFLAAIELRCFGILYKLILEALPNVTNREVAFLNSISSFLMYSSTIILAPLAELFSCRFIAILGGIFLGVGSASMYFAVNITYLYVSSVVIGIGLSCIVTSSVILIPRHFVKWRILALGTAVSGLSIGGIIQCPLLQYISNLYGFHKTTLMIGGAKALICILAISFKDPLVQPKTPPERLSNPTNHNSRLKVKPDQKSTIKTSLSNPQTSLKPSSSSKTNRKPDEESSEENSDHLLGNPIVPIPHSVPSGPSNQAQSTFTIFYKMLHLEFSLFKKGSFVKIIILSAVIALCHPNILIFVPKNATQIGMSNQTASYLLSAATTGELISRLLGWLYDLHFLSLFNCYFILTFSLGISLIALPFLKSFLPLVLVMFCEGFFGGSMNMLYPILIVEYLGFKVFPTAFGFCRIFQALMALFSPYIGGLIMDLTGKYDWYCWGLGLTCIAVVFFLNLHTYIEYRQRSNSNAASNNEH